MSAAEERIQVSVIIRDRDGRPLFDYFGNSAGDAPRVGERINVPGRQGDQYIGEVISVEHVFVQQTFAPTNTVVVLTRQLN